MFADTARKHRTTGHLAQFVQQVRIGQPVKAVPPDAPRIEPVGNGQELGHAGHGLVKRRNPLH